jgi:hypothetical protein
MLADIVVASSLFGVLVLIALVLLILWLVRHF